MSLAEKITVNTRYTRSINLERDRGSLSIMEAYLPTSRGIQLLDEVSAAFGSRDQPRAWSLIGPYGCGKSSFGLFLHELLGDGAGLPRAAGRLKAVATQALANESRSLAQRFRKQKPWCRVALTGSEESLPRRLLAALNEAGTRFWEGKPGRRPAVLEDIRRAMRQNEMSDSQVLKLIDALSRCAGKKRRRRVADHHRRIGQVLGARSSPRRRWRVPPARLGGNGRSGDGRPTSCSSSCSTKLSISMRAAWAIS